MQIHGKLLLEPWFGELSLVSVFSLCFDNSSSITIYLPLPPLPPFLHLPPSQTSKSTFLWTIWTGFCPEGGEFLENHWGRCNEWPFPEGGRTEAKWKGTFPFPRPGGGGIEHKGERERSLTNILHISGPSIANFTATALPYNLGKLIASNWM